MSLGINTHPIVNVTHCNTRKGHMFFSEGIRLVCYSICVLTFGTQPLVCHPIRASCLFVRSLANIEKFSMNLR